MPEQAEISIQLRSLRLVRVAHELKASPEAHSSDDFELGLSLEARMKDANRLVVELGVGVEMTDVLSVNVVYAAEFGAGSDEEEVPLPAEEWREFAARVAPTVVYPYARELISSLTTRAGLPAVQTPILNFFKVFDPETVFSSDDVAEAEDGTAGQSP